MKTKETNPTRPGSPTPRKQALLSDNRETNDKRNPSHTLSTMNNIFHGKVEVILNKNSCYFIQEKLFDIRFSYKHSNFSRVCLLVKMASKTVTRSILNLQNFVTKSEKSEINTFIFRTKIVKLVCCIVNFRNIPLKRE